MSRAYEYHIYTLEQPLDVMSRVRYKRDYRPRRLVNVQAKVTAKSEEEENRKQDEYLLKHGIQ